MLCASVREFRVGVPKEDHLRNKIDKKGFASEAISELILSTESDTV
jgi:hypothetical protein